MITFIILLIIGLIILWFLLSPLFSKIGLFVSNILNNLMTDEIDNKKEKEN